MATSQFDINYNITPYDFSKNNDEFSKYLSNYRGAIGGQAKIPDMYDANAKKFGVPDQQQQVAGFRTQLAGLHSQLAAVPDVVAGTTRDSLVTDAQRQRIVQAQGEPLQKTISQVAPAAAMAEQTLSESQKQAGAMTGMEMEQQDRELLPFEKEYDYLTKRTAMQVSGYSDAMKLELDRLVSNQRAGLEWSNAERSRANELAMAEMGYKNALEQISARGAQDRQTQAAPRSSSLSDLYRSFYG